MTGPCGSCKSLSSLDLSESFIETKSKNFSKSLSSDAFIMAIIDGRSITGFKEPSVVSTSRSLNATSSSDFLVSCSWIAIKFTHCEKKSASLPCRAALALASSMVILCAVWFLALIQGFSCPGSISINIR